MHTMRNSVIVFLLSLFFASNVGVNVFRHICSEDGVTVSYVFNQGEEHCNQHEAEKKMASCCHEDPSESDDDCCDDEVEYIKLRVDAEQHHLPVFSFPVICITQPVFAALNEFPVPRSQEVFHINPPPPGGKELLIRKQVWII